MPGRKAQHGESVELGQSPAWPEFEGSGRQQGREAGGRAQDAAGRGAQGRTRRPGPFHGCCCEPWESREETVSPRRGCVPLGATQSHTPHALCCTQASGKDEKCTAGGTLGTCWGRHLGAVCLGRDPSRGHETPHTQAAQALGWE